MKNFITTNKKKLIIGSLLVVISVLFITSLFNLSNKQKSTELRVAEAQESVTPVVDALYRYEGQEGVSALELLNSRYQVVQNDSGLVTTINGQQADDTEKEFWAFYINGKSALVGPEQYITEKGDVIEWKIETY